MNKFYLIIIGILLFGIGIAIAQSFMTFDVYSGLVICSETDSGDDYFNFGNVTASFTSNPSVSYSYSDNCLTDLILSEGVCGQNVNQAYNGYGAIVSLDCNSNYGMVCQQGRCIADTCGNAVCGPGENAGNCAQDCPGFCGDNVCNSYYGENYANCPQDCTFTNNWLVFNTANGMTLPFGNSTNSSLDVADQLCQTEATNLGFSGNFVSWLSNSSIDARDRIVEGSFVNLNQQLIANSKSDLLDGTLINAINNSFPSNSVATGTNHLGIYTGNSCGDWLSNTQGIYLTAGFPSSNGAGWTFGFTSNCGFATGTFRFYCFQVA